MCRPSPWAFPSAALALLAMAALGTGLHLRAAGLVGADDPTGMLRAILVDSALPRLAVAVLAGALLGLSGSLCQHILRNPLAEPSTLGVSAGAHLGLAALTLAEPALVGTWRELAALGGALVTGLVVFAIGWRHRLDPATVIIAGLVVGLMAGSVDALLTLTRHDVLSGLSLWSSGVLDQNGWEAARRLAPQLALGMLGTAVLARPLSLLDLDDGTATAVGLSLGSVRLAGLGLATALAAAAVSTVGLIGFVGLAAPWLAASLGARRFGQRWLGATLFGALLLWATDAALQDAAAILPDVPTGTVTGLLGSPLILLFLRSRALQRRERPLSDPDTAVRSRAPGRVVVGLFAILALATVLSLATGRDPEGWRWAMPAEARALLPWRGLRLAAAAEAGGTMAAAGMLLQRVTSNRLAGPEVLGIAPGVCLGVVLGLLFGAGPGFWSEAATGLVGAALVMLGLVAFGRRHGFAPEPMLLAGVAVGTAASAVLAAALASDDPRFGTLLFWAAGATDHVGPAQAGLLAALGAGGLVAALPMIRSLDILPLGAPTAAAAGLHLVGTRLALLGLAALLTTAATLVIGPLSFIGLLAPHMARSLGLARALPQLFGAVALGALVMVGADWLGRTLLFPYGVPAGLLASLVGGPYLLAMSMRRNR